MALRSAPVRINPDTLERLVLDLRTRVLDAEMRIRTLEAEARERHDQEARATPVTVAVSDAGPSVCPVSSLGTEASVPVTVKVLTAG